MRGAAALRQLVSLSARVEPLVTELLNSLSAADAAVQFALLCAIGGVLRGITKPLSEEIMERIRSTAVTSMFGDVPVRGTSLLSIPSPVTHA